MKKQQTDHTQYSEELEQLNFDQNEEEVRKLFEQENLPTASELEKYNKLMPNGAERILNIIEEERMRQYELERKRIGGRNRLNQLISASGLVLGIFLLIYMIDTLPEEEISSIVYVLTIMVLTLILAPLFWGRMK